MGGKSDDEGALRAPPAWRCAPRRPHKAQRCVPSAPALEVAVVVRRQENSRVPRWGAGGAPTGTPMYSGEALVVCT
ncbi:MAG: hypothetical protein ACT4NV_00100 [Rhodoferax sp.]